MKGSAASSARQSRRASAGRLELASRRYAAEAINSSMCARARGVLARGGVVSDVPAVAVAWATR